MDYLTMDENICPVCGKIFYTALGRDWGYSYKGSNYCSYHCMRHVEMRHRIRMGWDQRNWLLPTYPIDAAARQVAEDMRAIRHWAQAARNLMHATASSADPCDAMDMASAALAHQRDLMARYAPVMQALDGAQRDLMEELFFEAKPVWQVAADRHIDTDLLGVKLCQAYQSMAGRLT